MDLETIRNQYKKSQLEEPFIYHGKKYVLKKYVIHSAIFPDESTIEVFLEEIKD